MSELGHLDLVTMVKSSFRLYLLSSPTLDGKNTPTTCSTTTKLLNRVSRFWPWPRNGNKPTSLHDFSQAGGLNTHLESEYFNQYNNLYSKKFWGEILFQFEEKFNEQNSYVHLYVINNKTSFRQKAQLRLKGTKCKSSSSHFYTKDWSLFKQAGFV